MSNKTKTADRETRNLSASELDRVSGGAATQSKLPLPGPCFPRLPTPTLQIT
jgi:hypothetical protein